MKKLILLALTCAFAISIDAMESNSEGSLSSNTEELLIPVVTKSDKPLRTIDVLIRKGNELSKSLEEAGNKYYEINKQLRNAYGPSVNNDNPNQAQAKAEYDEFQKQRVDILAELKKLEEHMQIAKYDWFMNRIKHSKPKTVQRGIESAIGQYNRSSDAWHLKYCLFTCEQKMKLLAYAQTVQANRNAAIYLSKGDEKFEEKKPNPKILRKYNDACYVTLLMQEFKGMTVADQQKGSRYFEYQTNP